MHLSISSRRSDSLGTFHSGFHKPPATGQPRLLRSRPHANACMHRRYPPPLCF